ncbi:MAG TPA: hypothetical protein VK563_09720 [Puia sp.]|nr:hypothetical protein [Puia sp.]
MERLQELITQLKEQFERKASPSQMLHTTQLLEAELSRLASQANASRGSAKVAVMMPSSMKMYAGQQNLKDPVPVQEKGVWPFDPLTEIPTLAHQQSTRELNDAIGNNGGSSLNDKLKANVLELSHALNETPVRDLKKAIGVNDRYVFINQLFRGDEVMYERSIKTINSFRILPEAEYWMERELKVKLGWDETREVTRHFYQLVKRRFS